MADFSGMQQGAIDLARYMFSVFPELELESGYRPGEASYHGWGQAADIAAPYARFGVDVANKIMYDAARHVMASGVWRQCVEAIHNAGNLGPEGMLSVKDHQQVDPSFWGAQTWSEHENHLHLALVGDFHPPPSPRPVEEPDVATMCVLFESR